ncbi:MAG: PKD domain-containing protein, partial [Bacteroidota bacterium]
LFIVAFHQARARHIIGGVITYECLGNDRYEFTMNIYRDCNCVECAQFDQQAWIGIYRCEEDGNCQNLGQLNTFETILVPLGNVRNIEAPDYPCLIPPNVCVEEGVYRWTATLPASDVSYHISYQRCCRNVTINNIINPQASGATYSIEITPLAQQLCNNSPEFNQFPPTVICANEPLNFDHSATDSDGDQLVYEFCSPLLGGGNILQEPAVYTCDGAIPRPACPPPYDQVSFSVPNFTALQPMAGDPIVSINPTTGLITGTPQLVGQYVVGVCVSEFRNGQLLSRVFRDFQFNVASCDPTVIADIDSDLIAPDQSYLINSCGETTITFDNQSFQEQFIDEFEWGFQIGPDFIRNSTDWDATYTFPDIGTYIGRLILNPDTECGDTARIFVNIFPDLAADFSYEYDTCVAGPVTFTDLSTTGSCCLTDWEWEFGDGNFSTEQNPEHEYRVPGNIPVTLTVTDTNQCVETTTKNIEYFPVPALIVIAPSTFVGCAPADIFFDNLSFPIDTTYDIFWEFGDGGIGTDISPTHTYEDVGVYTVSVAITSPIGCETDTTFNDLITVLPAPTAGFSYSPDMPSNLEPLVTFDDESMDAINWIWDFGTGVNSLERNPSYEFPDTGMYVVQQVVIHPSGCTDTLIRVIDVVPEIRYFLPNAFTPNNDSVNDEYLGVGFMLGSTNFEMAIFNRWGELIFETNNPDEGWNGKKLNTGGDAPQGVYVATVSFKGPRGEDFAFNKMVTLLR